MALLGSEVVRHGISGYSAIPYGSFAGKTEQVAIAPVFSGSLNDLIVTGHQGDLTLTYSGFFANDPTSYSISPAVESGWTFNTTTCTLTVSDDVPGNYGPYTITATNAGGSDSSNAFYVTVLQGTAGGYYGRVRSLEDYEDEIKKLLDRERAELLNQQKTLKKAEIKFEAQMLVDQQNIRQKEQIELKLLEVSNHLLTLEQQLVVIEKKRAEIKKKARIRKSNDEVIQLLASKGWI